MAEICCGVGGRETTPVVVRNPSSRAARMRRIEIRRLRVVSSSEAPPSPPLLEEVVSKKRRALDRYADPLEIERKDQKEADDGERLDPKAEVSSDSSSNSRSISKLERPCKIPRYGVTSICGRRKEMEDAYSIQPNFIQQNRESPGIYHFFGVFDGHGCSHVAVSCKDRMHELVAKEIETLGSIPPTQAADEWTAVMERSFTQMDKEVSERRGGVTASPVCRCELQTPMCNHVGSTAVAAVVGSREIVVANCGDSRAVLCRNGTAVPLSVDHKPDRPDELRRIQEAGGRVIYWDGARVLGVLAMSRAIGDGYLKPFVVSQPEVTVTERSEGDECLVLASDGLWDVVSNETACYIVKMCLRCNDQSESQDDLAPGVPGDVGWRTGSDKACSDAAMLLTKLALARGSSDNVSVVVVDLRKNL